MLGLKKGATALYRHEKGWEREAALTAAKLKKILGPAALDIRHVGSTSVPSIKAKPIIDVAVACESFESVLAFRKELEAAGFYYLPDDDDPGQLLFACGSYYTGKGDLQTHFIHVVKRDGAEWRDYNNFREYLIANPDCAKKYEALKLSLAAKYPDSRKLYTAGKKQFIECTLRKALVRSYLGKTVHIVMDRPIGTAHPKHPEIIYPVNYGYLPGVIGGDGEELDVYLLGVDEPVNEYDARVIAIVHRRDDVEDKLVAAPEHRDYPQNEIADAVFFQEQFHDSYVESLSEKSGGTVPYTRVAGERRYLLIKSPKDGRCGFPKGHIERGETELEAALRETWEETSVRVEPDVRMNVRHSFIMPNGRGKTVVYFPARFKGQRAHRNPGFENNGYLLLPFDEALAALTYDNAREVLRCVESYLNVTEDS